MISSKGTKVPCTGNSTRLEIEYAKALGKKVSYAKVAEVGIQTMTSQEMLAYQKDIDGNIEKFRNTFKRADQIRNDYLEKAQKDRAFKGGMAIGAASVGLAGMPIVGAGGALILNKVSEGIKSKNGVMKDIVGQSKQNIQSITEDIGKIESYEKIISDWVEISKNPIEIVSVDDEFYINISGTETAENMEKVEA